MKNILKLILDLVNGEKTMTREKAESAYYEKDKKTKDEIYEDFKKNIDNIIKHSCRYETSEIIEIRKPEILERVDELVGTYRDELGYDVVLVDEKILGEGWGKTYMLISWRKDPSKSLYML